MASAYIIRYTVVYETIAIIRLYYRKVCKKRKLLTDFLHAAEDTDLTNV